MGFNSAFIGLDSTWKLLPFSKQYQIIGLTHMCLVLKATCFDQDMVKVKVKQFRYRPGVAQ